MYGLPGRNYGSVLMNSFIVPVRSVPHGILGWKTVLLRQGVVQGW